MTRSFPSEGPEYHLFYDAGAASIRATVVALQSKEVKDDPASKITKNVTSVDIKGVGWDLSAGGLHMDGRIRDILELQFLTGAGQQLEAPFAQNRRAQAKLLKEASRVKQVLSANAQSPSRVSAVIHIAAGHNLNSLCSNTDRRSCRRDRFFGLSYQASL